MVIVPALVAVMGRDIIRVSYASRTTSESDSVEKSSESAVIRTFVRARGQFRGFVATSSAWN
jgi:hypothetical protein